MSRSTNTGGSGHFSAEVFLDEAKKLRETLRSCDSAAKREFFVEHFKRGLAEFGVSFEGSPEELADRLALARALAGGGLASQSSIQTFSAQLVDESSMAAAAKKKKKKALSQRRTSSLSAGLFGDSPFFGGGGSLFDALLGRALPGGRDTLELEDEEADDDEDEEEDEEREEDDDGQSVTAVAGHPLNLLLSGLLGGTALDSSALQSLLGGEGLDEGDAEEGASPKRRSKKKKQLPFRAPSETDSQGARNDSDATEAHEERHPRLRHLIQKAEEKGTPGLASVLRKACADPAMRQALIADIEGSGVQTADGGSEAAGARYLLARLRDEGLL